MTKDKIFSAEEFLWNFIMTKTGTPETDMASIEDMSQQPEFNKLVGMLNDYASQFHPPTMTEEELRKEAEELYPHPSFKLLDESEVDIEISLINQRESHINARKMGAIKMDREENLTQQEKRDIAEKAIKEYVDNLPYRLKGVGLNDYTQSYIDAVYPLK